MVKIIDHKYDAIVVGSGGAGLCAALNLSKMGFKTAVISKASRLASATIYAEGEMMASLNHESGDKWQNHAADTLKSSEWLADQDAVHYLAKHAPNAMMEMDQLGIGFEHASDGAIKQTRLGLSKYNRGCGVANRTGMALVETLYDEVYFF